MDNPIILHNFTNTGLYAVTLSVTDNQGLWSTIRIEIEVVLMGDLDDNGMVNIVDITVVARAYGSKPSDQNWNPKADMDDNSLINILDISMIAKQLGKHVSP